MLITNGVIMRNIDAKKLPEYEAKGYEVVKKTASQPKKPKTKAVNK